MSITPDVVSLVPCTVVQQFVRSRVSQFCRCVVPSAGSLSWPPQHSCCWLIVFGGSVLPGPFPLPLPLVGGCPCCRWLFRSGSPHAWLYTCSCWIASVTFVPICSRLYTIMNSRHVSSSCNSCKNSGMHTYIYYRRVLWGRQLCGLVEFSNLYSLVVECKIKTT